MRVPKVLLGCQGFWTYSHRTQERYLSGRTALCKTVLLQSPINLRMFLEILECVGRPAETIRHGGRDRGRLQERLKEEE